MECWLYDSNCIASRPVTILLQTKVCTVSLQPSDVLGAEDMARASTFVRRSLNSCGGTLVYELCNF